MPLFSFALHEGPLDMVIFDNSGVHVIVMTPSNINAIVAVMFQHMQLQNPSTFSHERTDQCGKFILR